MATQLQIQEWELYKKKRLELFDYGIKNGLIHSYETEVIENLREIYCDNIPASIVLLCRELCNGFCFDRALLVTLGFMDDEFKVIEADVNCIGLNPYYIDKNRQIQISNFSMHSFAERTKEDGTEWVYDTSVGLVFEKKLYYELENPKIKKITGKKRTLELCKDQVTEKIDLKYSHSLVVPILEGMVKNNPHFYNEVLKKEIELFKNKLDYESETVNMRYRNL